MPDNDSSPEARSTPLIREAHDAEHHQVLKNDPSDQDARLDIALDESFPTSDAPGHSRPGSSEPAPSSGFDEKAEARLMRDRDRKASARSIARIGIPLALGGAVLTGIGLWIFMKDDVDHSRGW